MKHIILLVVLQIAVQLQAQQINVDVEHSLLQQIELDSNIIILGEDYECTIIIPVEEGKILEFTSGYLFSCTLSKNPKRYKYEVYFSDGSFMWIITDRNNKLVEIHHIEPDNTGYMWSY